MAGNAARSSQDDLHDDSEAAGTHLLYARTRVKHTFLEVISDEEDESESSGLRRSASEGSISRSSSRSGRKDKGLVGHGTAHLSNTKQSQPNPLHKFEFSSSNSYSNNSTLSSSDIAAGHGRLDPKTDEPKGSCTYASGENKENVSSAQVQASALAARAKARAEPPPYPLDSPPGLGLACVGDVLAAQAAGETLIPLAGYGGSSSSRAPRLPKAPPNTVQPTEAELVALERKGILQKIPMDQNGNYLTVGSINHPESCSPCIFWFKGECSKGIGCSFCHYVHEGQKKKRIRMSKRSRLQRRAQAQAALENGEGEIEGESEDYEEQDQPEVAQQQAASSSSSRPPAAASSSQGRPGPSTRMSL
eukprot:TRINITY_DN17365_c0_g1_i1.p1 TRINITY_DN17365_c0_g1~~TRINITY_DN17365_c0_g1_i1.p1  ORF type:complete len:362 (-),score=66.93 TRINITY_DN17365_c0_g1_i1:161-1246(-)